jgi:RNA polymerase sigma-70 factor (sigma-E family)
VDRKQERAFEEFIAESGDSLLRLATLLTSDQGLGEDVYQETLHRLAARWSRVDNPRAFCRRVMHNLVIDAGRARQRQVPQVRLAEGFDDCDPRSGDPTAAADLRPTLLSALRTLTLHQREIVVLRYFDDRSENEVADLLGISAGTVKSTLSRAVALLRHEPGISQLFARAGRGTVRYPATGSAFNGTMRRTGYAGYR